MDINTETLLARLRAAALAQPLTRAHTLEQDNIVALDNGWTVGLTVNK